LSDWAVRSPALPNTNGGTHRGENRRPAAASIVFTLIPDDPRGARIDTVRTGEP